MKIANTLAIALVASLSFASWTSPTFAAVRDAVTGRDAAMTRCLAQARKQYPGKYYDWGEIRDFSYQSCMADAGYAP
jgi:hypothetical protein